MSMNNSQKEAFDYLNSLPANEKKVKASDVIGKYVAQEFTDAFRATEEVFTIPVSWSLTKEALVSLLGITGYDGYEAITGIRFYAGLNDNNQLTLIAVSTQADELDSRINNDLTVDDDYPYYDYADPCPTHCSNLGNLKLSRSDLNMNFQRVLE